MQEGIGSMMVGLGIVGVATAAGGFIWYKLLKPFSKCIQLSDELDPVRSVPRGRRQLKVGENSRRFEGSSASMAHSLTRLLHAVTPATRATEPSPERQTPVKELASTKAKMA
jgi:hypothetical protein